MVPSPVAVAKPEVESIVATAVLEEVQFTDEVMSFVEPSEYVPVALNCTEVPTEVEEFAGVTAMDCRTEPTGATVKLRDVV